MGEKLGVYIHIPFCRAKCDYCDFYSLPRRVEDMDAYDTVFIGYPNWWGTMPMTMFTFLRFQPAAAFLCS